MMGLLTYLLGQFWPAILAGLGILGGWLWHSARVTQAERRGEALARQQQETANAEADAARRTSDDAVRRAGAAAARDSLRKDAPQLVRRVD